MQFHEWRPTQQRLHTAIATPSQWAAHMGLAGPHDMGMEFVRQVIWESRKVWLSHAKA